MENMPQFEAWENEYKNPKLMSLGDRPQNDVLRFLKWLKKEEKVNIAGLDILDLGCGTGRNSNYLSSLGNNVIGLDISQTALKLAKERALNQRLNNVQYFAKSIGDKFENANSSVDLILDVTSTNSLSETGREMYLNESFRVLKDKSYIFVRALCKDGDKNAKNLIKLNPGKEYDTYIIPEINLTERVFSEADFRIIYGKFFKIRKLIKKSGYARFNGQSYKRNYIIAYLQK